MKLGKVKNEALHEEIDGFDGGLWEHDGRRYVVVTTHGWGMRVPGGKDWIIPVAFSPQEPEEGEPNTYVMARDEFLREFKRVEE